MKFPELVSCRMIFFSQPGPDFCIKRSKEVFARRLIGFWLKYVWSDLKIPSICIAELESQLVHLCIVDSSAGQVSLFPSKTASITEETYCLNGWMKSGSSE